MQKSDESGVRHSAPIFQIKAAATDTGEFEGYASVFGVVDMFGEKVMPGAFVDSLVAQKRSGGRTNVKMFWSHDPSQPIGRWLELSEDQHGLAVKGQLSLGIQKAKEIHTLMVDGVVDGLSIGYREVETDFENGVRLLQKLDLLEISPVSLPANPKATIASVKGMAQMAEAFKAGAPMPAKDFEELLREAGFPKSVATQIASVGYAKAVRSESEGRKEAMNELQAALAEFKL